MKKEKHLVSKVGKGGFSLGKEIVSPEEVFEGYPSLEVKYTDNFDLEEDSIRELEHALEWLKWSDTHPPKIHTLYGRHIFFTICFESRDQKNEFLRECDLYRLGDKYLSGEDFAEAFGIDLATGTKGAGKKKSGMSFGKSSLSLSSSLKFGTSTMNFGIKSKKPEVSEHLKQLRASERQLAKLMEWRADPEYWICLAFKDEKDKENLLKALGLDLEFGGKYLWCHDVAKSLGIDLVPCDFKNKDVYSGNEAKLEAMVLSPLQ